MAKPDAYGYGRLGDQAGVARSISQLGILETDRGGSTATALRRELGVGPFTSLLADDTELAEAVTSMLDQWDSADDSAD